MNWLNNLKVAQRLILLIAVAMVSLVAISYTGYYYLSKANQDMENMYREQLLPMEWLSECRVQARAVSANIFQLLVNEDESRNKQLLEDINKRAALFNEQMALYEKRNLDGFETEKLKELHENLGKYRAARKQVLELALQNKNQEAYALYIRDVSPAAEAFMKNLVELGEHRREIGEKAFAENVKRFNTAVQMFIGIVVIGLLLALFLGWAITQRITKRLQDFVVFISELAKGNFSKDVSQASLEDRSEFGQVSKALDEMNKNIRSLLGQVSQSAEQLTSSSQQLTAGAEQSAQAATQIAESITQVAQGASEQLGFSQSSVQVAGQIAKDLEQVAANSSVVSSAAQRTAQTASQGEQALEKAVSQMNIIQQRTTDTSAVIHDLESTSQQIGKIVETISAIAGQTNLLALNAAIEAARAGEAGRGFAVVAEEVRKLAEQSEGAAKEITQLIGQVQGRTQDAVVFMDEGTKQVHVGTEVVSAAGESFREILKMVQDMSGQIAAISQAIEGVTQGTKQMVSSIENIEQESKKVAEETQTVSAATEEQSASMEEIAASSQTLARLAEELKSAVSQFKIR